VYPHATAVPLLWLCPPAHLFVRPTAASASAAAVVRPAGALVLAVLRPLVGALARTPCGTAHTHTRTRASYTHATHTRPTHTHTQHAPSHCNWTAISRREERGRLRVGCVCVFGFVFCVCAFVHSCAPRRRTPRRYDYSYSRVARARAHCAIGNWRLAGLAGLASVWRSPYLLP
jgi:hypothetical protein